VLLRCALLSPTTYRQKLSKHQHCSRAERRVKTAESSQATSDDVSTESISVSSLSPCQQHGWWKWAGISTRGRTRHIQLSSIVQLSTIVDAGRAPSLLKESHRLGVNFLRLWSLDRGARGRAGPSSERMRSSSSIWSGSKPRL
jgi:hypothetical protein